MKVLLANKFFFGKGGAETVFFQEREYLQETGVETVDFSMLDERNSPSPYSAYFVSSKHYTHESKRSVLENLSFALSFIHSKEAVSKFDRLILETRPDLVHCHNIYHQLTPSIIGVAKKHGLPVILTLHDYKPVCPTYVRLRQGRVCSKCLNGQFHHVLVNRCAEGSLGRSALLYAEAVTQKFLGNYDKVDLFIAPSQFMADSVTRGRLPLDKVKVLPNGVNVETVKYSELDDGYVLYFGRLSREKGVHTLLECQRQLCGKYPLKICGTGPLLTEMNFDHPATEFLGYQSGNELHELIAKSSMVVVPSEWYENCSMSILEAMAHGKPIVASRIGGNPELVVDGETGLLFEPGDGEALAGHIDRLMDDQAMRREFGLAGRNRAERVFSLKAHHEKLLMLYQALPRSL